jgi:hypothetical protein
MFSFLWGKATADVNSAKLLHTYLTSYHRTYAAMGFDFLLGTIKGNPLVSDYQDSGDFKSYRIETDLSDFAFIITSVRVPNAIPSVSVSGSDTYKGFSVNVGLPDGKFMLLMKSPTRRANNLCTLFQTQYRALRVS